MISLELTEWDRVQPASDSRLRGFRLSDPATRKKVQRLTDGHILEFTAGEDGLAVRSFSHVGRIELDGLTVTVRPKLAAGALLELLRYAYSLHNLKPQGEASFMTGSHGIQDLLVAQLQSEARDLIHRGIVRRYVRRSEALASPRGRLDVGRLAHSQNVAVATVPCTHYPRSSDFLLNQVVRAGLELARSVAVASALRRAVAHTAAMFAELAAPVELNAQVLRAACRSVDRLSAAYEPILRLIKTLYDSSHLDLEEDGSTLRVKGFFFDMNRFFQALLSKFLHESLPDSQVADEASLRGMMAYARGFNPRGRRSPQPRPDFVVMCKGQRLLLDAKYRDLWQHDLSRDMLYQLAIYALSQPAGATAAILYPTEDAAAREAIIDIREPTDDSVRARVAMRPVVIPQLLELLRAPLSTQREREVVAAGMVFGGKGQATVSEQ